MFKNVAGQSIQLVAVDTATGLQKAGDAANMVFYVSKDDGSVTAIASNSGVPTEVDSTNDKGSYLIALSQSETNADKLRFSGKSSTSGVILVPIIVYTTPNRFSSLVIDSAGLADATAVKVGPTGAATAQTARDIGAGVLVGDKTGFSLTQSFPSNFASLAIAAGGIVQADLQTIKTQAVTCSAGVTVSPFVGSTGAAINGTNANTLSGHDPGATLGTGTSTLTQTQVTGGAYALNSSSFSFNTALDFTGTQKTSLNAATPTVTAGTVTDKTGYALTSGERNSVADAILDRADAIETGTTLRQAIRYNSAILCGVITTAGTSTEVFKGIGVVTTRVTITVDASGNRSVVVFA